MTARKRSKENRRVLLLDAHSLAYRAFFALPDTIATTKGQVTNAVYGFLSMLFKVMDEEEPDAVIASFDGPRREIFRVKEYPDYKAGRPPMPDTLRGQMKLIEEILEAMGIPCLTVPGYEADDIIGTLSDRVSGEGDYSVIVTGDRDVLQLVDDSVRVLLTRKGISETDDFDVNAVEEKYGVPPERLVDIAALKGDSSDNIPGVTGIGEKGARKLINEYGSLEKVLENKDELKNTRQRNALCEHSRDAVLSKRLATIVRDVDIDMDPSSVSTEDVDVERVLQLLNELEFKTLVPRFLNLTGETPADIKNSRGSGTVFEVVSGEDPNSWKGLVGRGDKTEKVGIRFDISGEGYCDCRIVKAAIAHLDSVIILPGYLFDAQGAPDKVHGYLKSLLQDDCYQKSIYQAKSAILSARKLDIDIGGLVFDPEVAAYILDPTRGSYPLEFMAANYLEEEISISGDASQQSLLESSESGLDTETLAREAVAVLMLTEAMQSELERTESWSLYGDVEHPLIEILAEMEENGVSIDEKTLKDLSGEAGATIGRLEKDIYAEAGHEFNINSPKQLSNVLFEEMGIPPIRKTKTGFSTDARVLEELSPDYPIADMVISYRELAKLKSTYIDALPKLICPDTGLIHCSFNQAATATGRLSSSNPNLQNIPVRTEFGKNIRYAFVPRKENWQILVADYSQIELRVLAHMSGDEALVEAFSRGEDIHRDTAARVFGIRPEDVEPEQRRAAKMVNFGVIYGMSSYGLSQRLGITAEDASCFIDAYFRQFSGVSEYIQRCIEDGLRLGYAETILGRRRDLPELRSSNRRVKELGERLAINTPLQGSAADIIKLAMITIADDMERGDYESLVVLQVHDELVLEVAPGEEEEVSELVASGMSGAYSLDVDLKVDLSLGSNWGETK